MLRFTGPVKLLRAASAAHDALCRMQSVQVVATQTIHSSAVQQTCAIDSVFPLQPTGRMGSQVQAGTLQKIRDGVTTEGPVFLKVPICAEIALAY